MLPQVLCSFCVAVGSKASSLVHVHGIAYLLTELEFHLFTHSQDTDKYTVTYSSKLFVLHLKQTSEFQNGH